MEILVHLNKATAIEHGSDSHGLQRVDLPMDRLCRRYRETLADLVSSKVMEGYGSLQINMGDLEQVQQDYAPRVRLPGPDGLVEAIDHCLAERQRAAYRRAVDERERRERREQHYRDELERVKAAVEKYRVGSDENAEKVLFRWSHKEMHKKCSICGLAIYAQCRALGSVAKQLDESVQEEMLSLSQAREQERAGAEHEMHLALCEAKKRQMTMLFVKFANEEQVERYQDGLISDSEIRRIVANGLFRKLRGLAVGVEDYVQYGSGEDVTEARKLDFGDICHASSCDAERFGFDDESVGCTLCEAKYLTPEQYRFFRLVKAAYRGPEDVTATATARFAFCACTSCWERIIGFHVLVTLTTSTGLEFSRRFAPVDEQLAVFYDAAVWNDHE